MATGFRANARIHRPNIFGDQLGHIYKRRHVFVQPSHYENQPTGAMTVYQAAGYIGRSVGAIRSLIHRGKLKAFTTFRRQYVIEKSLVKYRDRGGV